MPPGPTRVILDVKGGVDDWKEPYKQFLLTLKGADGYFRYRWGPWDEDQGKLEIICGWLLLFLYTLAQKQNAKAESWLVFQHLPNADPHIIKSVAETNILPAFESQEKLKAFGQTAEHRKAVEDLKPVLKTVPSKCPRFDFDIRTYKPPPDEFLASPRCTVITIKNCKGNPADLTATLKKAEAMPGCIATFGDVAGTDTPKHGTVWIGFVGWQSAEAAKAADKSAFVPSGVGDVETHNINLNFPIKGFSVTNPGR